MKSSVKHLKKIFKADPKKAISIFREIALVEKSLVTLITMSNIAQQPFNATYNELVGSMINDQNGIRLTCEERYHQELADAYWAGKTFAQLRYGVF